MKLQANKIEVCKSHRQRDEHPDLNANGPLLGVAISAQPGVEAAGAFSPTCLGFCAFAWALRKSNATNKTPHAIRIPTKTDLMVNSCYGTSTGPSNFFKILVAKNP
ncbi:hypothetical protein [Limnohabitans sp. Bal53]|uniref:hypothetical protein n=1 Tax=Limnohabitans sp. Bal53 TaxID=1977910 RepID=UPI0011B1FCE3|nr:hypothetical protein [Limnohabitans sp. Bal53]